MAGEMGLPNLRGLQSGLESDLRSLCWGTAQEVSPGPALLPLLDYKWVFTQCFQLHVALSAGSSLYLG